MSETHTSNYFQLQNRILYSKTEKLILMLAYTAWLLAQLHFPVFVTVPFYRASHFFMFLRVSLMLSPNDVCIFKPKRMKI